MNHELVSLGSSYYSEVGHDVNLTYIHTLSNIVHTYTLKEGRRGTEFIFKNDIYFVYNCVYSRIRDHVTTNTNVITFTLTPPLPATVVVVSII